MRRLSIIPQVANHSLAVFPVLTGLQGIDIPEQFLISLPVPVSQGSTQSAHSLRSAVVMSQLFQVFLQVKAIQHMLRVWKSLAQRYDPARAVSMNVYSFHLVEVVPFVHACLYLVVESLRIHPVTGDMKRIDQLMPLRVARVNPFRDRYQRYDRASSILKMNMVFIRKGIDSLIGMFRCMSNCLGDVAVTSIVAKSEGQMDMEVYCQ